MPCLVEDNTHVLRGQVLTLEMHAEAVLSSDPVSGAQETHVRRLRDVVVPPYKCFLGRLVLTLIDAASVCTQTRSGQRMKYGGGSS
jgi:hypothetical protein